MSKPEHMSESELPRLAVGTTFRRRESNDFSPRPWRSVGYVSTVAEVFEAEPVIRDVDGHIHYLGYVERIDAAGG